MADDQQQEVVIVDKDGTEHIFPAGFDPMKAAAIVRKQTGESSVMPVTAADMLSQRGVHTTAEQEPPPSTLDKVNASLRESAHPQTVSDLAGLMLPGVGTEAAVAKYLPGSIRSIIRSAPEAIASTGRSAARGAAAVLEGVPTVRRTVPLAEPLTQALERLGQEPMAKGYDRFLPNTPNPLASVDRGVSSSAADIQLPTSHTPVEVDRYMPNSGGMTPVERPTSIGAERAAYPSGPTGVSAPSELDATIAALRKNVSSATTDEQLKAMAQKILDGGKPTSTVRTSAPPIRVTGRPVPGETVGPRPGKVSPNPDLKVVEETPDAQVKPSAEDVLALEKSIPTTPARKGTGTGNSQVPNNYMDQLQASLAARADQGFKQNRPVVQGMENAGQFGGDRTTGSVTPAAMREPVRITPKPSVAKAGNLSDFMKQVDDAMAGAASKSKSKSGWKNLSDNDAITAANAYASGVRNPDEIIAAILEKRKSRQALHIDTHYMDKQEVGKD